MQPLGLFFAMEGIVTADINSSALRSQFSSVLIKQESSQQLPEVYRQCILLGKP